MGCPICESAFKEYGFRLEVGLHAMTQTIKACCPRQVWVTYFDHNIVKFKDMNGNEYEKSFMDFMKSSWRYKEF